MATDEAPKTSTYEVDINGIPHTMQLTDEDAERYGDRAKKARASTPNKTKTPANKKA